MPLDTHPCAAEGCTEACPRTHLMCVRHWRMVPKALRNSVWAAFRRFDRQVNTGKTTREAAQELLDAKARAIAAVREKEIRKELRRSEHQPGLGF